jgi:glycosyltransferase involved in cell wall biosynthesis
MGELFRLNNSLRGKMILTGIKKAHKFIATTSHIKNHLLEFGFIKDKIVNIPNGVDVETFRPRSLNAHGPGPMQCKKVLFVGRLSEEKGVIPLIKAWRILLDWYDDEGQLILEIIGDGPQRLECLRLVDALGLTDSVKIMGNINNVQEHLMSGDIFVLPSYFEGLSNALLEAMACALPIVATRVSGNAEVIEDGFNGLLVGPDNPIQMAEKILLLLKEKELALRLGQNARMTVEDKFSLDRVVENYITLYKELLTSKG